MNGLLLDFNAHIQNERYLLVSTHPFAAFYAVFLAVSKRAIVANARRNTSAADPSAALYAIILAGSKRTIVTKVRRVLRAGHPFPAFYAIILAISKRAVAAKHGACAGTRTNVRFVLFGRIRTGTAEHPRSAAERETNKRQSTRTPSV